MDFYRERFYENIIKAKKTAAHFYSEVKQKEKQKHKKKCSFFSHSVIVVC